MTLSRRERLHRDRRATPPPTARATAGSDYVAQTGTLTFTAGQTSKTITVAVNGDTTVEPNETFTVTLERPRRRHPRRRARATGTITNDDVAPLPTLSINDVTVTEGNAGTIAAQFTVTLSAASSSTVTVELRHRRRHRHRGQRLRRPDRHPDLHRRPDQQDDHRHRQRRHARSSRTRPSPSPSSGPAGATLADAQATGTITNDDVAPLPTLSINDVTVTEGNAGTIAAQFTVTLSAASSSTVTVNYATADGTRHRGQRLRRPDRHPDLHRRPDQQDDQPSPSTATRTVEPNETFTVTLSAPTNATLGDASGTGTIQER